ncbi:MAG TPA: hypothetical protein DCZ41_03265 [Firmicutes bacterium]|nr:hypothetical protein [Bacillota bacterium]
MKTKLFQLKNRMKTKLFQPFGRKAKDGPMAWICFKIARKALKSVQTPKELGCHKEIPKIP